MQTRSRPTTWTTTRSWPTTRTGPGPAAAEPSRPSRATATRDGTMFLLITAGCVLLDGTAGRYDYVTRKPQAVPMAICEATVARAGDRTHVSIVGEADLAYRDDLAS